MSIQAKFLKFHDQIKISREDSAYKDAREKDDSILKDVKSALKDEGYPVIENFLQGSMSTATGVKNPCSGQLKLATVLEFSQYNRSDSLGVRPPIT
ncbi:hypothetical protein MW652_001383 [Vibrio vulnificus]|nr:hypothetical protein [Vibrio vulnificus]